MIEDIKEVVTGGGGIDYSALRVDHSTENNSMNLVDRLIDMTHELREEKQELVQKRAEIIRRIEKIHDAKYIEFLELRYIDRMKLEEIAKKMGYAEGTVRNFHRDAVKAFEEANPDLFNLITQSDIQ